VTRSTIPTPDPGAGDPLPDLRDQPPATGGILERLADQRVRLQIVAAALAQPLDPREVASQVIQAACGVLNAPQGWVGVVSDDGTALEIIETVGYPEALVSPWRRIPLETRVPATDAVRLRQSIFHASAVERQAEYPVLARVAGVGPDPDGSAAGSDPDASAVAPLVFQGRSIGALALSFQQPRVLGADERWFLESLAAQAAQGLERARLFAEVQERDERLRFALEASGTGTWDWDLRTDRLTWSSEVFRLHGLPLGTIAPGTDAWLRMVDVEDRALVLAAIEACLDDGGTYDVEFRVHRPDGELRWLHSVGRPAPAAEGRATRLLGTMRDITDRRLAEEERDHVLAAEREAARLRDAFTGVVSHELRTPITTIFVGTRLLARRWRDMEPETRDGILTDVVEEADRLYRLVEDLLVITRVERGTVDSGDEPVHLGRVAQRVTASEQPRWPGVVFTAVVPPDLPSVAGEETYVEQIVRNLLGNAAKYGGAGSTVTVVAEADRTDVFLRVLDDGPGIDAEDAERLFDLFYRSPSTAARVTGAGIGLFVCRQLVTAMGGHIRAERRAEGGSAFVVSLPRYADDHAPDDDAT